MPDFTRKPSDVNDAMNGNMPDEKLVGCGVFAAHSPQLELKMHPLAATAMKVMVATMITDLELPTITATETYRNLARQIVAFDGTDPKRRTKYEGRYIPDPQWKDFAELDPKVKHWNGFDWKRRLECADLSRPGFSNHGFGLAIDFDGALIGKLLPWLRENASALRVRRRGESERELALAVPRGRHVGARGARRDRRGVAEDQATAAARPRGG